MNVRCIFGHKWGHKNFWVNGKPKAGGITDSIAHPYRMGWLLELESRLRKEGIPAGWYPCFSKHCERCGKEDKHIKIDTLYPATSPVYPAFKLGDDNMKNDKVDFGKLLSNEQKMLLHTRFYEEYAHQDCELQQGYIDHGMEAPFPLVIVGISLEYYMEAEISVGPKSICVIKGVGYIPIANIFVGKGEQIEVCIRPKPKHPYPCGWALNIIGILQYPEWIGYELNIGRYKDKGVKQ